MPTVLIVAVDANVRAGRGEVLAAAEFNVLESATGTDAIAQAETHHPDLVLLDVLLPDLDGFEVRRRLRKNRRTSSIPIVHTSAHLSPHEIWEALKDGAEAVLIEPFTSAQLLKAITATLSRPPFTS